MSLGLTTTEASSARRQTLRVLWETPESDIGELSSQLVAWENGVAVNEITYKQRKRVYTSLRQSHLPKLDEAGVVDYDRDRGTVTVAARASTLERHIGKTGGKESEVDWSTAYLAVGVVGLCLTLLAASGLLPAASGTVVAGVLSAAVALVAGVHRYSERDGGGEFGVGDG